MSCCCADGVKVSKMALEVKSGQMLFHKRRIFGRNWREAYVVLYNDSTLTWYRDKGQMDQEGGLVIKDAPELLAFGQFTSMIPNIPEIPDNYSQKELLAFGTRGRDNVYWFLCPTEQEVESWMTAISNTLPPPPNVPSQPQIYAQRPTTPVPGNEYPQQPAVNPQPPSMPPSAPQPPPYMQQPGPAVIPGQYPTPTAFRPPYTASPLQPAYQYSNNAPCRAVQPAGANTTVVVQDGRRNDSGGDFAMGMLVGGAIGTQMGHGWGHGYGWGWGGGGGAWHHSGPTIHDTDVTINNYYDVDNTVVNNDVDIDASRDMTLIADDVDFGGGDYGTDFGGDMGADFGDIGGF